MGCSSPPDVGAGGILTYTREIVEVFLEEGHEVHIAAPEPEDWGWLNSNNIKFVETDQYKNPIESVSILLEYIGQHNIEGIINNDNPYVQSLLPAVKLPSVVIGHLGESVIASLACFQEKWTDYIVAISNDMFSTYVQKYKVPVTKCPIVFNGVKDYGCENNLDNSEKLKVVFAGGFNKRKGCKIIVSSIKNYGSRLNGIELNWFGSVPNAIRRKLEAFSFIRFHGHVDRNDFISVLENSDVLLFPSKSEGCPMAMLEAMRSGVVPIASDGVGAMTSLITNGREGYICHLDNWGDQATECLSYLSENRNIMDDMKRAVREKYLLQFQSKDVADRLLELLAKPTVRRDNTPNKIKILHWHRPVPKGKNKGTILNRIRFRLGVLRRFGYLSIGSR